MSAARSSDPLLRIAVIGSGIAGLGTAYTLAEHAAVTLYEAGDHFGGHTRTVDVTLEGHTHGVDTGFLVFNHRTYPNLVALFEALHVETAPSDMSFSVQVPHDDLEWSGSNLNAVFAQRRNLWRVEFWRLLKDIVRFNGVTTRLARRADRAALHESMGEFLARHRFSAAFRDWYFLPMVGSIWSCPTEQMLRFPVETMIRFCHNHGLIQITDRPQWHTVRGGARHYVERMLRAVPDARRRTPVRSVRRTPAGVEVHTDPGVEAFDEVVFATHADQALALLADPTEAERELLGAIRYQRNRAILHTDAALLPTRRRAWAAWNYECSLDPEQENTGVCLHYWLNGLQPLPFRTPLIETLNPIRLPRPGTVLDEVEFEHPVFDAQAIEAQQRVERLQGLNSTWYCGAWLGCGFHEDGLKSGLAVARALLHRIERAGSGGTVVRGQVTARQAERA